MPGSRWSTLGLSWGESTKPQKDHNEHFDKFDQAHTSPYGCSNLTNIHANTCHSCITAPISQHCRRTWIRSGFQELPSLGHLTTSEREVPLRLDPPTFFEQGSWHTRGSLLNLSFGGLGGGLRGVRLASWIFFPPIVVALAAPNHKLRM